MIFNGTQCCCVAYQDSSCADTPTVVIVLDGNRAVVHLSNFKCETDSPVCLGIFGCSCCSRVAIDRVVHAIIISPTTQSRKLGTQPYSLFSRIL